MGRISALTEVTQLASDDYLVVLDSSANIAKKVTVANALGIPDQGFIAAGESWTYSAWSSTTRIAEITVPTDATTKYYNGMRVKFTQPTDGVKIGIIMKVEATKLHVFMHSSYDFDNEAITSPFYSSEYAPAGFDLDPTKWQLVATDTTLRTQASPTTGTWYNLGSFSLSVGVGAYNLDYRVSPYSTYSSSTGNRHAVALSTSSSSVSDAQMLAHREQNALTYSSGTMSLSKFANLTSPATYYVITRTENTAATVLYNVNDRASAQIRAVCAYI